MNTDNRNGTMIGLAAFRPATTTTNPARVTSTRVERGREASCITDRD